MTRLDHLRRAALLCCHCMRNFTFYQAGWKTGRLVPNDDFWKTVNGNFLDICILEWCKLFADQRDRHHWSNVVIDENNFEDGLLATVRLSHEDFDREIVEIRQYRDKFIAHLDADPVMHIPELDVIQKSVAYL